jgi:hypothetical protein
MQPAKSLEFKYRFVQNGQAQGLGTGKGMATDTALILNGEAIPYRNILDSSIRDNRFLIALVPNTQLQTKTLKQLHDNWVLVIEVYKVKSQELKKHVDQYSSTIFAESHRQQLINEGKGNQFRAVNCPHCGATVDMSEYEISSYIYCRFCESILNQSLQVVSNSERMGSAMSVTCTTVCAAIPFLISISCWWSMVIP